MAWGLDTWGLSPSYLEKWNDSMQGVQKKINSEKFDDVLLQARRMSFSLGKAVYIVPCCEAGPSFVGHPACHDEWTIVLEDNALDKAYRVNYDGSVHEIARTSDA